MARRDARHAGARRWIERAAGRIAARTRPERIILFGSCAAGRGGPDSDVDLLVILDRPRRLERRYRLVDDAVGRHRWPLDLLVCGPEEVAARIRVGDPFFQEVLRRGVVLYES